MGEDDTIGFESLKQTRVYWNIDEYPIPVDTNTEELDAIFGDMFKALDVMGFRGGYMTVWLYSEQLNSDEETEEERILKGFLPPQGESYSVSAYKVPDITLYLIRHASNVQPGPVNFLVIAKPKRELDRVLWCLKSRRHNVLLVKPLPPGEEFLFTLDSLLENARFLGGGKPRFQQMYASYASEYDMCFENYVEIIEDVSKTVDFSERIPTVKGARTAVFWDAVDCPFPPCSTPDDIYHSISSALVPRDFSDNITIWAYLDDDDDSWRLGVEKTWPSRIYFLPGGDKASRRIRMFNDIYLWKRDSPLTMTPYEQSLVIFSHHFRYAPYYAYKLQQLSDLRYDLLLVTPTPDINKPDSPQWSGLLIDKGAAYFADQTYIQNLNKQN